ncbi:unnamed protein product [Agarophyton chilense]
MSENNSRNRWEPNAPCILGIDEAGRGPVLGPMVYAAAVCPKSQLSSLRALGVNDSKSFKEDQRDKLRDKIEGASFLRIFERCLTAAYLSQSMLRRKKYNLNLISHDTALGLVQDALDKGVNVTEIYVDTVGNADQYAAKFRERFPTVDKVIVAKKADSTFPIVGAASIMAKTTRDKQVKEWCFPEELRSSEFKLDDQNESVEFIGPRGSGYPSDPVTKIWMEKNYDNLFGFPTFVRFSWGTTKTILQQNAVLIDWECDDEDDDDKPQKLVKAKPVKTKDIKSFFSPKPKSSDPGPSKRRNKDISVPQLSSQPDMSKQQVEQVLYDLMSWAVLHQSTKALMNMTEAMHTGSHSTHFFQKNCIPYLKAATSGIKDAFRRSMGDENIDIFWNPIPHILRLLFIAQLKLTDKLWRPRRAVDFQTAYLDHCILQIRNTAESICLTP